VLAVLSVGLLFAPGAAQPAVAVKPVSWGCSAAFVDYGQCSVPSDLTGVTAIAAADSHSLALQGDGTVVARGCGGLGNWGQCSVPSDLADVTAIAAGFFDSLALKANGTVVAWGCQVSPDRGQCNVPSGLAGVTAIAAGFSHTLALTGNGTVTAWGCAYVGEDYGQCIVPADLSGVTAIAAGLSHSLALKGDGTVVAWGCGTALGHSEDWGQCSVPAGLSGVTAIAAGEFHSLALKGDGTVVAWGCGISFGQCGAPISGVIAIDAAWSHSLALKRDGTVVAWGCRPGDYGQCSVPSGLCGVTAIAAGNVHSLALAPAQLCQMITFGPLANRTYGDPDFTLSATASSGLPVSFAASGNCTVSAATVHLIGAGSCTVTAAQPGSENYYSAPNVSQTFAIAKARQSISFGPLPNRTYGAPDFRVLATASSGLAISFAARGRCTLRGSTVHLTGVGSCTVTASQPGDANYNPAPAVSRSFSIRPPPCKVPKVVGKRVASAKRTIAKRHCRTGKVGYAYSRKRKKGIVISQSRRPGKVLPARSKINLVVSRGRKR